MKSIFKQIYLIICILSVPLCVEAQQLEFSSSKWDFGTIAEDGGEVSHTFEFENRGSTPIVIITVHTTCGCTSTNYTRKPIVAGERSTLEVSYDPMNRPGEFAKTISILTSADEEPTQLVISGDVTPRIKSTEELYPFDMGEGLRTAANYFAMSSVVWGEPKSTQLAVINDSDSPIYIELKPTHSSGFLQIDHPSQLAPHAEAIFNIDYLVSSESGYYGTLKDNVDIYVNGEKSRYQLIVSGNVIDKFTNEERNLAPCANIDKRIIKFATLKRGKKSEKQYFEVENTGVAPLIVRRVEHSDDIEVEIEGSKQVEAGERMIFEIKVKSSMIDYGAFTRYITLTFNDPDRPMQRVRITGIVED